MTYLDYYVDYLQRVKEKAKELIPNLISLKFDEMDSHYEDKILDLSSCDITLYDGSN